MGREKKDLFNQLLIHRRIDKKCWGNVVSRTRKESLRSCQGEKPLVERRGNLVLFSDLQKCNRRLNGRIGMQPPCPISGLGWGSVHSTQRGGKNP